MMRSLAENQPLVDGNKRAAWLLTSVILAANGQLLRATVDEAVSLMQGLAAKRVDLDALRTFLARHAEPIARERN